jgi:tetratricopeptide (TPR) repeat protein
MRPRVEELFHEVADLSADARNRYFAERGIDAITQREVEALLAFDARSSTSLERDIGQVAERALARLEPKGAQYGPYRLGELLGRGGMGTVYLAERIDGELAQRVAIKLLRPGTYDPRARQRFLAERQILANLSHPNIARLLDAGHGEDGQPYLVMEYVEGKAIDVYCTGLSIRSTITLFLKVCSAVGYLHRNLIVHRDLKPLNILVTGEGEPKLLDFGIAKMLDFSTDSTVTGMRMLTPDYASPEQVVGGSLTTATDIYSLGAVLYKLLTGVSPRQFEGASAGGLVSAISAGRITPPSELAPELKGDLEMILVKALRPEPKDRYTTIEQFAEDLKRYLDSRPIRAGSGGGGWYRARKLLRRYWLPAAAATLTLGGLLGGMIVANHQRAIAQRRSIQVRQLANRLFAIDAEFRQTPGTSKAREVIVRTSLEYLKRLAPDASHDPELALELGTGYLNIARLQGVPLMPNLGRADQAAQSLNTAEGLIRAGLAARPGNRIAFLRLAQIAHDRMSLAPIRGGSEEVLRFAQQSANWLQKYDDSGPIDRTEADALATTYLDVGNQYAAANQFDEAIRFSRRAGEVAAITRNELQAGTALTAVANNYRLTGELERALEAVRQASRQLGSAGTADPVRSLAFIDALTKEGAILGESDAISLSRPDDAVAILRRAFSIADDLAQRDANDTGSRNRLYMAGTMLAGLLRSHAPGPALSVYDHVLSRLAELNPGVTVRGQGAAVLAQSSPVLRRLGRRSESRNRLNRAVAELRELGLYPVNQLQPESAMVLAALAEEHAAAGDAPRAAGIYEDMLRLRLAAGAKPDVVLLDATQVSSLYAALAALHSRAGHSGIAAGYRFRRVELWRRWDARLPNNRFVRLQLYAANEAAQPNFGR